MREPVQDWLAGRTIRLTPIHDTDIDAFSRWYSDFSFLQRLDAAVATPLSTEQVRKSITDRRSAKDSYLFGIRKHDADNLIGFVELDGVLWNQQVAWIAMGIGEASERHQGHGSEALRLLLQFAFWELNLRRVQLTVFSYNASAIALYEKMGFQREGVYREFIQRQGDTYDMYLYGLLRSEWEHR